MSLKTSSIALQMDIDNKYKDKDKILHDAFNHFIDKAIENKEIIYEFNSSNYATGNLVESLKHKLDYLINIVDTRINNGQKVPDNYFNKLTYTSLSDKVREWDKQKEKKKAEKDDLKNVKKFSTCKSGRTWFKLTSEQALSHEACMLNHCVKSYWSTVVDGDSEIYSLRKSKEDKPIATLHLMALYNEIDQVLGFNNSPVEENKFPGIGQDILDFITKKKPSPVLKDSVASIYGIVPLINSLKSRHQAESKVIDRVLVKNLSKVKSGSLSIDGWGVYNRPDEFNKDIVSNPLEFNNTVSFQKGFFVLENCNIKIMPKVLKVNSFTGLIKNKFLTKSKVTIDAPIVLFTSSDKSSPLDLKVTNGDLVIADFSKKSTPESFLIEHNQNTFEVFNGSLALQLSIPNVNFILANCEKLYNYKTHKVIVKFFKSHTSGDSRLEVAFENLINNRAKDLIKNNILKYEVKQKSFVEKYKILL